MRKLRPSRRSVPSSFDRLLAVLIGLAVLAAVPAGVGATAAPAVAPAPDRAVTDATDPTFGSSATTDQRGDVVRIVIRVREGGTARLTVIGKENDYRAELEVSDDSHDGLVVVEFNTFLAGQGGAFQAASEIDAVRSFGQQGVEGVLPAGGYRLLTDGTDERADLTLEPRSTDAVDVMVAPERASERLTSAEAVTRYRRADNLTVRGGDTPEVASGDTLVVRLKASGLSGALDAQPGDTVTEQFRSLVGGDLVSLSVVQTNHGTNVLPARLMLNRSGVHVVTRPTSDAYFLVVDTTAVSYRRGDAGTVETGLPADWRFRANVTVHRGTDLSTNREIATGSFLVVERSASVGTHSEAGEYYVEPARAQTVNGTTTLAPGSSVRVRVASADGDFQQTHIATVRAGDGHGVFSTAFDLGSLSEGTTLDASVHDDAGSLTTDSTEITVRSPVASLEEPTLTAEGGQLRVTLTANLTRGGVLTVRADNASGRLVGALAVDSGRQRVSVPLVDLPPKNTPLVVTAVRDLDGDGQFTAGVDVPYEEQTSPRPIELTIVLYRTPPSPTPSPTATTAPPTGDVTPTGDGTPGPGGSPATPTDATPTDTPGGDPIPGNVPGFNVPVALAAVALALVLLRRRGR